MFTKFYEIPSLSFKDIEKPKRRERTEARTDGREKKHSLRGRGEGYNWGLQIVVK